MTFIASVIAQKGVAIIADSLVTLMENVIEADELREYLDEKTGETIDFQGVIKLIKRKPNYTKNYTEKLFQYDKYTAITTAGGAYINQKSIEELIIEHTHTISKDNSSNDLNTIVDGLTEFFKHEASQHIENFSTLNDTLLYVTHFNEHNNETTVSKITVGPVLQEEYSGNPDDLIRTLVVSDFQKVICDGQNGTSDRVLFGDLSSLYPIGSRIINFVYEDLGIDLPDDYVANFFKNHDVLDDTMRESLKILKLNSLSLQQAVNLAALLMKIERDLQSFTENIPTVGGVIKMAVIDKEGFRMILGNEIEAPNI